MTLQGMLDMALNPTNGAAIILIGLVLLGLVSAWRAQQMSDFSWPDMLKDAAGKPSGFRLGIVISLVMSSWVLVVATVRAAPFTAKELTDLILIYLAVWSGSPILSKAFDLLLAKYAGTKTTEASTATETKEKT